MLLLSIEPFSEYFRIVMPYVKPQVIVGHAHDHFRVNPFFGMLPASQLRNCSQLEVSVHPQLTGCFSTNNHTCLVLAITPEVRPLSTTSSLNFPASEPHLSRALAKPQECPNSSRIQRQKMESTLRQRAERKVEASDRGL